MGKRGENAAIGILGIIMWIGLAAAHVYTAAVVFKSVKLWAFLVILLVPGIGDIMGIVVLFKIQFFFPLIVYAVSAALYLIVTLVARSAEKLQEKK